MMCNVWSCLQLQTSLPRWCPRRLSCAFSSLGLLARTRPSPRCRHVYTRITGARANARKKWNNAHARTVGCMLEYPPLPRLPLAFLSVRFLAKPIALAVL